MIEKQDYPTASLSTTNHDQLFQQLEIFMMDSSTLYFLMWRPKNIFLHLSSFRKPDLLEKVKALILLK